MMKPLSYQTLDELSYPGYLLKDAPEKVLQFGEGNFLRAFADYFIDCANEQAGYNGKAVVVQPISQGLCDQINEQEGLYTLYLRGALKGQKVDEKRVISSISRCINPYTAKGWVDVLAVAAGDDLEFIVSNTTEAGIVYQKQERKPTVPDSFPAKLTEVLFARFMAGKAGVVILSCELIDHNGEELKRCVYAHAEDWALGDEFIRWLEEENYFCSTLVDRIVPGRVREAAEFDAMTQENGYLDELLDVGEVFGVWMIEGPKAVADRLPFGKTNLPVSVVEDITAYKHRKVRILNGAHTGFVPSAYLAGFSIVRDCMYDEVVHGFMDRMLQREIIPTLTLDRKNLEEFAEAVTDRFANPFVDHQLLSIALNSTSKWKARNLPSLLEQIRINGSIPPCLAAAFAGYLAFYTAPILRREADRLIVKHPNGSEYPLCDDADVLDFYEAHQNDTEKELVWAALSNVGFWEEDLTRIENLPQTVLSYYTLCRRDGAYAMLKAALEAEDEG